MADAKAKAPQPWADHPMKLIVTPTYATKKKDPWTQGASSMALAHNAILRAFNSIYLQAPHIPDSEKPAFVGYATSWYRFVTSHHEAEEEEFFPNVCKLLNDEHLFDKSVEEHHAFLDGVTRYNAYLTSLKSPSDFSAPALIEIMDSFRDAFESHFHAEIVTLVDLANHPNAPAPNTAAEADIGVKLQSWGRKLGQRVAVAEGAPFFFLNLDRTAEDGLWASWPPVPSPVRWILVNLVGAVHSSWWKFTSCDTAGKPRPLWALKQPGAHV